MKHTEQATHSPQEIEYQRAVYLLRGGKPNGSESTDTRHMTVREIQARNQDRVWVAAHRTGTTKSNNSETE